jgi:hypothetical protein
VKSPDQRKTPNAPSLEYQAPRDTQVEGNKLDRDWWDYLWDFRIDCSLKGNWESLKKCCKEWGEQLLATVIIGIFTLLIAIVVVFLIWLRFR